MADINQRLEALEARLRKLHVQDSSDPVRTARELADVERELHRLAARHPQTQSAELGGGLLTDNLDWRNFCARHELNEAVAAADQLTHDYLLDAAREWEESLGPLSAAPTAQACFEHLLQTTVRNLEAQCRQSDCTEITEIYDEARRRLRPVFEECVQQEAIPVEVRQRWTTELLDRGDLVLTAIDDLPPERASVLLGLMADDLQWHVGQIERRFSRSWWKLRRKLAQIRAEQQERDLQQRLEARFGRRFVSGVERLVLALICLVVALMLFETWGDFSQRTILWLNLIDLAACTIFLSEFFTKLWMVQGRFRWFRRHFLIDFIPSLPVGIMAFGLTEASKVDAIRAGRLARFLRLPRLARYVRLLRPFISLLRGFGLMTRGLDRMARQYGHIFNQNVILYPTRGELDRAANGAADVLSREHRLQREVREHWKQLVTASDEKLRGAAAEQRIAVLEESLRQAMETGGGVQVEPSVQMREIPASVLIERLERLLPQDVEPVLGEDLTGQLARSVRLFARPPLCWFPIISSCVPRISSETTDADVVAAAARRLASLLKRYHDAWFWVADLYGTVTPSQFVDRVGTMLVNSSFRPAYRLVLFGGFFLITDWLLELTRIEALGPLKNFLNNYVGPSVMVVGGVCFVILGMGWWLKRLAREATEFYERAAQARYLALTEVIRSRHLRRDSEILYDRVLRPEWLVLGNGAERLRGDAEIDGGPNFLETNGAEANGVESVGAETIDANRDEANWDEANGVVAGALNRNVAEGSGFDANGLEANGLEANELEANGADEQRGERLEFLLERIQQSVLEAHVGGSEAAFPALEGIVLLYRDWLDGGMFTDSDTRTTSQLLGNPAVRQFTLLSARVDRKQMRMLNSLDLVRQKSLFGGPYLWFNFVSRSIAHSVARLLVDYNQNAIPLAELPLVGEAERQRYEYWLAMGDTTAAQTQEQAARAAEENYMTTAFTVLHFLDCDPRRDAEVEQRFGPEVLRRLQEDRSVLIRRVFGTYPMHDRPKEQRVVNLYTLYGAWLAGGRALLLPWYLFCAGLSHLWTFLAGIARAVQEIRNRNLRGDSRDAAKAHFLTAVRKIDRIRGPVVYASMRLRMKMDPEYLGIPLPGCRRSALDGADVNADLTFLHAPPDVWEEVEHERRRAEADMKRLETFIAGGLLERLARSVDLPADAFQTREHVRSAAVAYLADYRETRSLLTPETLLDEIYRMVSSEAVPAGDLRPCVRLRRMFKSYWREHGFGDARDRRAAWKATVLNHWGAADALRAWHRFGDEAVWEGTRRLATMLMHPGRINDQLTNMRAIQTLSILDVLNYREHIYDLGRYTETGDSPGRLLDWETTLSSRVVADEAVLG